MVGVEEVLEMVLVDNMSKGGEGQDDLVVRRLRSQRLSSCPHLLERDLVDQAKGSERPVLICDGMFWDLGVIRSEWKWLLEVFPEAKQCAVVVEDPGEGLVTHNIQTPAEYLIFEQVGIR